MFGIHVCQIPIFLVVVGSALATGGFLSGLVQFVSYGMGMGLVLIVLTLGIALFKEGIFMSGLHRIFPYVERTAVSSWCSQALTSSTIGCTTAALSRCLHRGGDKLWG